MDAFYFCLIGFLFLLAIFDLFVGVSNDAVNFLNSAIGAKVARFKTIIIIAAIGIFVGASFSTGMMDIARHGMFHPQYFTFQQLMVIFVAVTASDIVLMDIFNSLGMPTSTTVSMVFELLGGTFAISLLKIAREPGMTLGMLVNTDKALAVIIAIFVSVAVAFAFGILVQYLTRLLFSFTYKTKSLKWKIGLFSGVAGTAILYFLVIKGLGGSTIIPKDIMAWIKGNTGILLVYTLIGMTVLMQILHLLKVNVFKILVLMGTFSLAMAFAGNDLVNFIGVSLAGLSSFQDFTANGTDPSSFMMDSLNGPAHTSPLFLIAAGVIMVIALATSKKAHKVIKTSVDLARQDAGDEMFGSSKLARFLVRTSTNFTNTISMFIPQRVKDWAETRLNNETMVLPKGAAFDEVRATVNLVLASLLIALGTSLKLPLSTTYVTFMVAMGTSLADRAWGRESAVFRVTGVLSVISGWFLTAGAAFMLCFIVAMVMFLGGKIVTILMICLAITLIIRSNIRYKKKAQDEDKDVIYEQIMSSEDHDLTMRLLDQHVAESQVGFLDYIEKVYTQITDGFFAEDLRLLGKVQDSMRAKRSELKQTRRKEIIAFRKLDPEQSIEKNTWFHLGMNGCEDVLFCLRRIADPCQEHIDNNFVPLDKERIKEFLPLRDTLLYLLKRIRDMIQSGDYSAFAELKTYCDELEEQFSAARKAQFSRVQTTKDNITVSYVYLNLIQESQQLIISMRHLIRAARHFHTN